MNGLPSAIAAINAMRTKSDTANTRGAQWRRSQWRRWTRKAKVLAQMASGSTGCSRSPLRWEHAPARHVHQRGARGGRPADAAE